MSNDLTIKDNTNLSKALEEFQQFKNKQIALPQKQPNITSEKTALTTAHEILQCGKKIGARSLMTYEVTGKEALLINASQILNGTETTETRKHLAIKLRTTISGDYEGCPYCGQGSVVHCHCGAISCGPGTGKHHTCPGCGNRSRTVPARQPIALIGGRSSRPAENKIASNTTEILIQETRTILIRKK